ncbi:hypothetical protein OQA88_8660 [Cercophora sp. LCS_1]
MDSQEERLCASCVKLNLVAAFDSDHFDGLPRFDRVSLGDLQDLDPRARDLVNRGLGFPAPEWIRYVGRWTPPDPKPPGVRTWCPFCSFLIDMAARQRSVHANAPKELFALPMLFALPSRLLYDIIGEQSAGNISRSSALTSLLVINAEHLITIMAYEQGPTGRAGHGFTAISFEPPKTAKFALVLDTIDGVLERIGLFDFFVREVAVAGHDTSSSKEQQVDNYVPEAHRRRIRLG